MPELPEVETVRRGLQPLILKKKIRGIRVDEEKCFRGDVRNIEGAAVVEIRRRGKALIVDLDNGWSVMVHLRMTGQLIWRGLLSQRSTLLESAAAQLQGDEPSSLRCSTLPRASSALAAPLEQDASAHNLATSASLEDGAVTRRSVSSEKPDAAHAEFAAGHPSRNFTDALPNAQTRMTFEFEDGKLFFNDQRKFGFVKPMPTCEVEKDKFIAELAKEPWEMAPEELFEKCQRHGRSSIKAVLLNQKLIAGLGNIYADESLYYAGVHPASLAGTLSEAEVAKILEGACEVMQRAIDSGGSTMATYVRPDGTTGNYLEKFAQVFRLEGQECRRCGAEILKTRCAGRGTHYCPQCQKCRGGKSE